MVYYYPEKQLQANLIGKFDQETIGAQADKYLRGRLATWKPTTNSSDMKVESRDCQAALEQSGSADEQSEADRLMEEEIMREILEEEAARKKEENTRKNIKGSKDKKKKKKSKKGKKKSKKDEL